MVSSPLHPRCQMSICCCRPACMGVVPFLIWRLQLYFIARSFMMSLVWSSMSSCCQSMSKSFLDELESISRWLRSVSGVVVIGS